jgi:hypothetical protein
VPSDLPIAVALVGLGATLALVVLGFWLVRRRDNERAALPEPSATASALRPAASATAPVALEPTALFAKAKSAALAWHTDAALTEIDISPVNLGKVGPSGKLVFSFGKPAGKKLGPGSAVQTLGFVVTADESGLRGDEQPVGKVVSVAEPNCIFEDVLIKVGKAGVSASEALHLHYAMSEPPSRGVWRVSRAGGSEALRTLDGASCAIIVR